MTWVVRAPARELRGEEKRLYTRVRRLLWDYEPLRASHAEIHIHVHNRAVRLRGRVRTLPQKIIAAALVSRMPEVDSVSNELIADPEVVRDVADALAQDERTAAYVVRVEARHGIIFLRGELPSDEVEQAVVEVASGVPTVASVRSTLTRGGEPLSAVSLPRLSGSQKMLSADAASEPSVAVPA
ncbi:MAG TPA: BON domain-containing protein [Chloroflexota bacterium]|nr:BON domain-containing protein [Chloroflexota bacterium]